MASYPNAIPSFTNPTSSNKFGGSTVTHSNQHININDEVLAIATELGTDPAGNFSTVVARLNAISSTDSYWVDDGSGNISYGTLGTVTIDDDGANGVCQTIDNDGTNHGLYIKQDGVLAASKYALYMYSNAVLDQSNAGLCLMQIDNPSSTNKLLWLQNDGSGDVLYAHANGTGQGVQVLNAGTNNGIYMNQTGVLAASKYGLYVYTEATQANSPLVKFYTNDSGVHGGVLFVGNSGQGPAIEVDCDSTGHGLYLHQDGVLATDKHGLYVYSNAIQNGTNSELFYVKQNNASSTQSAAAIANVGTGHGLNVTQGGVLANSKSALNIASTAAQVNNYPLVFVDMDNASSTSNAMLISNDGTGHGLWIEQEGVNAASKHGLLVESKIAQTNDALVAFTQYAGSSTQALKMTCNTTGTAFTLNQAANGKGAVFTVAGNESGLEISKTGVLTSAAHALYVSSSEAHTIADTALVRFNQAGAATEPVLEITNAGTGPSIEYTGYIQGPGSIVQVVNTQTGAVDTGSTVIVNDDTIPQNDEGDEYMTRAITPTSATNKLKIDVVCSISHSAGGFAVVALFQDTTAGALAAVFESNTNVNLPINFKFTHYMDAGTTSETTFKIRAGFANVGTTTFNGSAGGRKLGGVAASSITITEIGV